MIKKNLIIILIFLLFYNISYSADSNSNDVEFKKEIERKYNNVKCILSSSNIGMGAGNNLGIKNVSNDYAFILKITLKL